jgi:hypothetical protein
MPSGLPLEADTLAVSVAFCPEAMVVPGATLNETLVDVGL